MARQFLMLLMFGLIGVGRSAIDDAFNDLNEYRLPRSTRPTNYDLWLKVDVDRAEFSGSVKITIEVIEQTDTVALNVRDVNVDYRNVSLMDGENVVYKPSSVNNDINREILSLKFDHRLKVNNVYVLSVQFDGAIRNDTKGLYKTSYQYKKSTR
jgi:Peptidase M1 N-terminal domain